MSAVLMKTATGYIKTPYNMGDCYLLEQYLSVKDENTDQYIPYGYIVHDNALYIPNINIERFMKPLGETEVIQMEPNPWRSMSKRYMSRHEPRDALQENVISFITGERMFKQNQKLHQIGIVMGTGKGKAMPLSTTIPTPTGIRHMGELKVGDQVFSKDGTPTKVLEIYDQGVLPVYEVKFDDTRSCECSEDHLWEVMYFDPSRNGFVQDILPLKEIRKSMDEVGCKYFIQVCDPVEYKQTFQKPSDMDAMMLGNILGNEINGSTCMLKSNLEIAKYIGERTGTRVVIDPNTGKNIFYRKIFGLYETPVTWSWMLRKLGIRMQKDFQKRRFTPEYLYPYDWSMIRPFLEGMFAANDCNLIPPPHSRILYGGKSKSLAQCALYLGRSMGFCPDVVYKNEYYLVFVTPMAPNQSLEIVDIIPVGEKPCRCIKVDHPSHTFLAADCIVTHNTFTSIYSITNLNRKTLIVTHMTKIEDQWMHSMLDMFDYHDDSIMRLSTNMMTKILEGYDPDKDVYFVNHQVLSRWLSTNSPTKLNEVFKRLGIGIKIIDEYHLHWRNSLILDMFTNIDKTIYLTATYGRSNQDEDILFKRVTENVVTYGSSDKSIDERHTEYHPVLYNSHCPFKTVRYMGNGHGVGMKKWVYADWAHINDPEHTANKIILELIQSCLKSEGKILVTVASIKTCDVVAQLIQKQYPDEIVGVINSSNSVKENQYVKDNARIIVSTIQSSGTGVDIKKLRYVINAEPFSSKITAEQFIGRLRPYYDANGEQRTTYLFDLVDKSIYYCNVYFKARSKRINQLAKESQPIEM